MQSEPQSPKPADEMRAPAEWDRPPPKAKPNETSFESSATLTRPALYIVGTYLSIGTLLFSALEGWGLSTSIYFCVITLTTVGYGDIAPATTLGRAVATLIMIMGYGIIAVPTGIVTLELNEANRRRANTTTCSACSAEGHSEEATFCWRCGENMYKQPSSE